MRATVLWLEAPFLMNGDGGSVATTCGWSGSVVTGSWGLAVWTPMSGHSMSAERLGELAMPGGWEGGETCAGTGGIMTILEWAAAGLVRRVSLRPSVDGLVWSSLGRGG